MMQRLNLNSKIRVRLTREGVDQIRKEFPQGSVEKQDFLGRPSMQTLDPSQMSIGYAYMKPNLASRIDVTPDQYGYLTIGVFDLLIVLDRLSASRPEHLIEEFFLIEDEDLIEVDPSGQKESVTFELLPDEAALVLNSLILIESELDVDTSDAQDVVEDAIDLYKMTRR